MEMPFSSELVMELHYNQTCLQSQKSISCFTVEALNNNIPLKFDTCIEANKARGSTSTTCTFEDFVAHLDKRKVRSENIFKQCQSAYDPYPMVAESLFLRD